ncbi:MAG: Uma2 family endonuclease [Acidobacteria bacterium]|nr:Uma2 family endonuclease [Acidobacteriota bacterium]
MATATISLNEYLRTSYEWEPEWVAGELVEREMSDVSHSDAQTSLLFLLNGKGVWVGACVRLIMEDCVRIPDLMAYPNRPAGDYPSQPPLVVAEVLSPGDRLADLKTKCREYAAFGIPHIWVVDPADRSLAVYGPMGLMPVSQLNLPEYQASFIADDVFGPAD